MENFMMYRITRLLWAIISYPFNWYNQIFQALFPDTPEAFSKYFLALVAYYCIFRFIIIPIFGSHSIIDSAQRLGSWVADKFK